MYSVLDIIEEMCEEDRLILDILKREYILDNEEALEKFENKYGFDTIQSDAKDIRGIFRLGKKRILGRKYNLYTWHGKFRRI